MVLLRSLLGAILDGNFTVTETFFDDSTKPLATVLAAIVLLLEDHPACWVQVFIPDDANAEIGRIWIADPVYTEHVPFLLVAWKRSSFQNVSRVTPLRSSEHIFKGASLTGH